MAKKANKKKQVWKPEKGVPSRFPKGTSGNPNGRPKGIRNRPTVIEFEQSIARVEKKKRKNLIDHFIERAYENDKVLIAVMKKRFPDLRSIEGMLGVGMFTMSDEEAAAIQKKLKQRWVNNGKGS